jgi:hypothetical protein
MGVESGADGDFNWSGIPSFDAQEVRGLIVLFIRSYEMFLYKFVERLFVYLFNTVLVRWDDAGSADIKTALEGYCWG